MLNKKKLIIALSIIPQYFIIKILANYPKFIETYYSGGLYQFTSKILRYAFGWLPFSVGDTLYTIAGIYVLRWLVIHRKRLRLDTKNWFIDVFSAISVGYLAFHLFWGLNYYRIPVYKSLNIDYKYTTEELIQVTEAFIEKANIIQETITNNDTVKVTMPYSKKELFKSTLNGYQSLGKKHPIFNYQANSIKQSIYSLPLTYMGFSGYLNPFTNEAQIDGLIPLYQYPATACHEQAHQLGYAAENETNFIGYLAAIHNSDIYFKYSGYVSALRQCLNEVYRRDKDNYEVLRKKINKGILLNYQESYNFWTAYENPLEPIFKVIYSNFLKANNQDKGIESYSYAVALLVNYYKNNPI
ncbi:DUF3810 domain-containing protein [Pontimicrobium aquaticum]|uniref:DUF3810 domain-containing protein n=1 Tax=Pontimicrobium aquaticum TaxID=2565367 RepID=A0A4U0EWD3_9FLAO|nr:DUF3810 domain-containing protein [Pontimicrobium aquaticum]TJY36281.1 DUF3810 domain-containing protein [Pontimicrobium aquaticum]